MRPPSVRRARRRLLHIEFCLSSHCDARTKKKQNDSILSVCVCVSPVAISYHQNVVPSAHKFSNYAIRSYIIHIHKMLWQIYEFRLKGKKTLLFEFFSKQIRPHKMRVDRVIYDNMCVWQWQLKKWLYKYLEWRSSLLSQPQMMPLQ